MSDLPLPPGWVQEYDTSNNHPYWVDTKSNPPRAIWVHPYEDEQFLLEHPEIKDKVSKAGRSKEEVDQPPPYEQAPARRHSYSGERASSLSAPISPGTPSVVDIDGTRKRSFFGKMKDKAIGTKEERQAEKKRRADERVLYEEEQRRLEEEYRQARIQNLQARQAARANYGQYGHGYPGVSPMYGPPMGSPYGYDGYSRSAFGGRGGGMGMGGMALPLLGGLAGGLLLGDMLDGGFGGDGFDGGGGFDGGFGGGGFF